MTTSTKLILIMLTMNAFSLIVESKSIIDLMNEMNAKELSPKRHRPNQDSKNKTEENFSSLLTTMLTLIGFKQWEESNQPRIILMENLPEKEIVAKYNMLRQGGFS